MKKFFVFIFTLFLFTFCSKIEAPKEVELVSVPYTVQTAQLTKVSYNQVDGYSIKNGDKLHIAGANRGDISGYLEYDSVNDIWSGDLWYNPDTETGGGPLISVIDSNTPTQLTVTLVHADNADESTYACSIADTFTEAVEKYSLLEGDSAFGQDVVTLYQKSCFINTSVDFRFIGVGSMTAGQTSVDIVVGTDTLATGRATFAPASETNTYNSTFVIAIPGDTELTAGNSFISICDRNVPIRETTNVTLEANKSYNISRTYDFKPELGDPYWSDGTYGRIEHSAGIEVVGIIVYVNDYDDSDNSDMANVSRALTEKDYGYGHALVMSLWNAASDVRWGNSVQSTPFVSTPASMLTDENISGYHNTELEAGNSAADYALGYRSNEADTGNDSGWFLPSIGQWVYSISTYGFGGADPVEDWTVTNGKNWITQGELGNLVLAKKGETSENLLVISLNERLEVLKRHLGCDYDSFGMSHGTLYGDNYWTSSEATASEAVRMNLGSVEKYKGEYYSTIKVAKISKSTRHPNGDYSFSIMKVRPFLAF